MLATVQTRRPITAIECMTKDCLALELDESHLQLEKFRLPICGVGPPGHVMFVGAPYACKMEMLVSRMEAPPFGHLEQT